jgi:hypothetical protein
MADSAVSGLVQLLASELDGANDFVYVVDASAGTAGGKYMAAADLVGAAGGVHSLADGSAAAPSLTNLGDTDTGAYFSAADTFSVATGGSLRASFSSTGLDIVPATDATGLEVKNADGSEGGMILRGGGAGLNNTFIGKNVGDAITTGIYNVGIGYQSLLDLTEGNGNFGLGLQACYNVTTGSYNVGIGYQALTTLVTGSNNLAIGFGAGKVTTGNDNVFMGYASGFSNTSGAGNVCVGENTAYGNTTGSYNVCIGNTAGRYQGASPSTTALTDAESSIYIGYLSRGAGNTDENSIVIGTNTVGIGPNTCVIGRDTVQTTFLAYGAHQLKLASTPTPVADHAFVYAADQAAGNACVHCQTEGGDVLKLYQGAAIADATDAASVITQLNDLLAHLRLMGVIAT